MHGYCIQVNMATKMMNENNSKTSASRKHTTTTVSADAETHKSEEEKTDKGRPSARAGGSSQNLENVRPTQAHIQGQGSHTQTLANKGAVVIGDEYE